MYSLLLLPLAVVKPLLPHLLTLLEHLNELNCYLPNTSHLENLELEGNSQGKAPEFRISLKTFQIP